MTSTPLKLSSLAASGLADDPIFSLKGRESQQTFPFAMIAYWINNNMIVQRMTSVQEGNAAP
jgi:hypothetical protein